MTSMPASRKERAITLAPRSCPSRPGFATSTRIFRSTIDLYLTTEGAEVHSYRGLPAFDCRLSIFGSQISDLSSQTWRGSWPSLHGLDIQASPQIPAGHRPIWFPRLCDLRHHFGFRHLALLVMFLDCHLDAVISCGQHIGAPQSEHQKHMCSPHSYALDLGQMLD